MATIFKQLFFATGNDNLRMEPHTYITLSDHSLKDGWPLVTAQFVESEIDSQIDLLIKDLEKIRKELKRKFKAEKERMHTQVSS